MQCGKQEASTTDTRMAQQGCGLRGAAASSVCNHESRGHRRLQLSQSCAVAPPAPTGRAAAAAFSSCTALTAFIAARPPALCSNFCCRAAACVGGMCELDNDGDREATWHARQMKRPHRPSPSTSILPHRFCCRCTCRCILWPVGQSRATHRRYGQYSAVRSNRLAIARTVVAIECRACGGAPSPLPSAVCAGIWPTVLTTATHARAHFYARDVRGSGS